MKDWEQIGHELRDEYYARYDFLRVHRGPSDWQPRKPQFTRAKLAINEVVGDIVHGGWSRLVAYLRSDHPLDRKHRNYFADLLQTFDDEKVPAGRPRNSFLQFLAEQADEIYREWKARNKKRGINDWGVRDSMKYQACMYAIEAHDFEWDDVGDPDPEAIMQLLARPKSRRKTK